MDREELRALIRTETRFRSGLGFDVHRLEEGYSLILGGVEIPWEKGLVGHSDADVIAHAVMDAVLGAAGEADIGTHFPDTDEAYRGADSLKLTTAVATLVRQAGFEIENLDVMVLAEKPKLAPHMPAMKENLAHALGLELHQIALKATTTERLGFAGRQEGIAAFASALLRQVSED